ncbi:hypothetical protein FF1_047299 [Malus domestica]|uniref:exocyst complex component EXO70H1-like n=1 Tax=Malus domestica TaxID=3750 RepID=UPI000498A353|nr:exocyst complex component EXO70H1-like [Malus domestica]
MRTLFFKSPSPSPSNSPSKTTAMLHLSPRHSFSNSLMEENIEIAEAIIAMQHFLISQTTNTEKLIRAQNLMQSAMKRLEKEFYQIMSANREYLDAETISSRSSRASTRTSVSDQDSKSEDESQVAIK